MDLSACAWKVLKFSGAKRYACIFGCVRREGTGILQEGGTAGGMDLIVLFGKTEEAHSVRGILVRNGYEVAAVCTTGAQALSQLDALEEGIIVCGYKYADMVYSELLEELPKGFELLLIASGARLEEGVEDGVVALGMPLKTADLISTLGMMIGRRQREKKRARLQPKKRSPEELALLARAKAVLMERNHMSEEEAHRYIQKSSMDSGTGLIESAQMVLAMLDQ